MKCHGHRRDFPLRMLNIESVFEFHGQIREAGSLSIGPSVRRPDRCHGGKNGELRIVREPHSDFSERQQLGLAKTIGQRINLPAWTILRLDELAIKKWTDIKLTWRSGIRHRDELGTG